MMDKLDFQFRNELSYCRKEMGKWFSDWKLIWYQNLSLNISNYITLHTWPVMYLVEETDMHQRSQVLFELLKVLQSAIFTHFIIFFFLLNELFSVFKWKLEFFFFFFCITFEKEFFIKKKKMNIFNIFAFLPILSQLHHSHISSLSFNTGTLLCIENKVFPN